MKVTAVRSFTYDTEQVKDTIREMNNDPNMVINDDEVMDYIDGFIQEDMRSPLSRHDVTVVDEDGNEI
jgi:hypothetical protein